MCLWNTDPTLGRVVVRKIRRNAKKVLLSRTLTSWQDKWSNSENGRVMYQSFPRARTRRLQGDFHVYQVLMGHGDFGDDQDHIFRKNPTCFCGEGNKTYFYPGAKVEGVYYGRLGGKLDDFLFIFVTSECGIFF